MEQQMIYRQGDVMLVLVNGLPEGEGMEVQRDNGRLILAYGETSGHGHAIADVDVKMIEKANVRYIISDHEFHLEHIKVATGAWTQEHLPHTLPAGVYEIRHQREYVEPEVVRRVMD